MRKLFFSLLFFSTTVFAVFPGAFPPNVDSVVYVTIGATTISTTTLNVADEGVFTAADSDEVVLRLLTSANDTGVVRNVWGDANEQNYYQFVYDAAADTFLFSAIVDTVGETVFTADVANNTFTFGTQMALTATTLNVVDEGVFTAADSDETVLFLRTNALDTGVVRFRMGDTDDDNNFNVVYDAANDTTTMNMTKDGSGNSIVTFDRGNTKILFNSGYTLEIDGPIDHDGTTLGFYGATPASRTAAYTPSNVTPDRAFDANSTTTAELADIIGTILADMVVYGLLQ